MLKRNQIIRGILILVCLIITAQITISQTSSSSVGPFTQFQNGVIGLPCSNTTSICDSCNITSITFRNKTLVSNAAMTKVNNEFSYTFQNTSEIGNYNVAGICLAGSEVQPFSFPFEVTATGNESPNTGMGLSLIGLFIVMIVVSGFFLLMAWMSTNQVVKSMFIGLSAFIMATIVFFGMSTMNQILGGFTGLVSNYYTFWFFMMLVIVIAVFATLIFVLVRSMYALKIKRGALDPDNFEFDGRMQ